MDPKSPRSSCEGLKLGLGTRESRFVKSKKAVLGVVGGTRDPANICFAAFGRGIGLGEVAGRKRRRMARSRMRERVGEVFRASVKSSARRQGPPRALKLLVGSNMSALSRYLELLVGRPNLKRNRVPRSRARTRVCGGSEVSADAYTVEVVGAKASARSEVRGRNRCRTSSLQSQ